MSDWAGTLRYWAHRRNYDAGRIYLKHFNSKFTMPSTPSLFNDVYAVYFGSSSAIDRLRERRKPDEKPKKPKPVTDEQLLAIVDELQKDNNNLRKELAEQVQALHARIATERKYVDSNFKLRWFAPTKRDICSPHFEL